MSDEIPSLPEEELRAALHTKEPTEDQIHTLTAFYLNLAMERRKQVPYEEKMPGQIIAMYENDVLEASGMGGCDHVDHFVTAAVMAAQVMKLINLPRREELGDPYHFVLMTTVLWSEKVVKKGFWKRQVVPLRERFDAGDPSVTEEVVIYIIARNVTAEASISYRFTPGDGWEWGQPEAGIKRGDEIPEIFRWGNAWS